MVRRASRRPRSRSAAQALPRHRSSFVRSPRRATSGASSGSTAHVVSVHKLGERWRAEVTLDGHPVVVVGQAGAGIAVDTLAEDRIATVTGHRPPAIPDRL